MEKELDLRYPNSANLFQFCRRVLDHRFGGARVIDQDIGQILGFDPADCSHWKKGKKNIRSIQAIKAIAFHLGADERLVVDVASGDINEQEAFLEYIGYGQFRLESRVIDAAKKEFYRRSASWDWGKDQDSRSLFDLDLTAIEQTIGGIHESLNLTEAPLYIPEIFSLFPSIQGRREEIYKAVSDDLKIPTGDTRPVFRFFLARSLYAFFVKTERRERLSALGEAGRAIEDVEKNHFAARLLVPSGLLKKEMSVVDVTRDIVSQLAETFWVSKSLMNRRIKDVIDGTLDSRFAVQGDAVGQ